MADPDKRPDHPPMPNAPYRVQVVDPSLFTLPYDEALLRSLVGLGVDAELVTRRPRQGEPVPSVPNRSRFYRLTDARSRSLGTMGAVLKAAEHCVDMARFSLQRSPVPVVTHFQWLPFPMADRHAIRVRRTRGPVVVTVHDTTPFNGNPTAGLQSRGFHAALAEADRLIVHTRVGHERLLELGMRPDRVVQIEHGPLGSASAESAPGTQRRESGGRQRIVAFGKIRPYKGIDLLVEALGLLGAEERAALDVVIAGEPMMDLKPLTDRVASSGLQGCVTFIPRHFGDAEMQDLLATADTFVFPYREIEASGVLFLVQGFGRWIIASRLGAFAEMIVDGQSGRLVPPGDVPALAAALREVALERPTPTAPLRATGWDEIAARTRDLYEAALAEWSVR